MFAVIKTGGKQYKVEKNNILNIEKVIGSAGETIEFSEILFLGKDNSVSTGTPMVSGAKVKAEIVSQGRDEKIIVFKKKRRQNYRRKAGHQQEITRIKITDIVG